MMTVSYSSVTIHSSKIIFLGGINNEVKKSVKKGNVGMR